MPAPKKKKLKVNWIFSIDVAKSSFIIGSAGMYISEGSNVRIPIIVTMHINNQEVLLDLLFVIRIFPIK